MRESYASPRIRPSHRRIRPRHPRQGIPVSHPRLRAEIGTRSAAHVGAEQLMSGCRQLISRARRQSIRVIGTTISPFEGASIPGYYTPQKETVRHQINSWIRGSGEFDAVVDLDAFSGIAVTRPDCGRTTTAVITCTRMTSATPPQRMRFRWPCWDLSKRQACLYGWDIIFAWPAALLNCCHASGT